MYILHFLYPLCVDGNLDCIHLLATVNKAAMNKGVQKWAYHLTSTSSIFEMATD